MLNFARYWLCGVSESCGHLWEVSYVVQRDGWFQFQQKYTIELLLLSLKSLGSDSMATTAWDLKTHGYPWHQILPELQFQGHQITHILHIPTSTCYSLQEKLLCPCGGRRKRRRGWGGMDHRVWPLWNLFTIGMNSFMSVSVVSIIYIYIYNIYIIYIYIFIIIHHYSSFFIIIHLYSYTCTCIFNPEDMAGRCPFASVSPFQ